MKPGAQILGESPWQNPLMQIVRGGFIEPCEQSFEFCGNSFLGNLTFSGQDVGAVTHATSLARESSGNMGKDAVRCDQGLSKQASKPSISKKKYLLSGELTHLDASVVQHIASQNVHVFANTAVTPYHTLKDAAVITCRLPSAAKKACMGCRP